MGAARAGGPGVGTTGAGEPAAMRIVHVPFSFPPDPPGGTEVYVAALAHYQRLGGARVVVAAPGDGNSAYTHEGQQVRRFAVGTGGDLREIYGAGDPVAARNFGRILDDTTPDIVHLHAFTSAVSLRLIREARARAIPVVFTHHTPGVSCQRGTLLLRGDDICDGALHPGRCTACTLQGLGVPRALAAPLGRVPVALGRGLGAAGFGGPAVTALRMRELIETRHDAFRRLITEVDQLVAVSRWVREVLLRNGAPPGKLSLSRQGLPHQSATPGVAASPPATAAPLRIAFLGRLDPIKGLPILIEALRGLPSVPVALDCYGLEQGGASGHARALRALAAGDARITWQPPVPSAEVVATLRGYHLLAVPSQCLETGPLVVLEAFAAGVPVLGSRLGGIAELVRHEIDGLLVEHGDIAAWRAALRRLADDRALLARLTSGVRPPRTMQTVAEEMLACYRRLLARPG